MFVNDDEDKATLRWSQQPDRIIGLDHRPRTPEELADVVRFMMEKALLVDNAKTVTCYSTTDHLNPFTALKFAEGQADGIESLVVMYYDLPDDLVFFASASLRADVFVRKIETTPAHDIFAMWDRKSGLSALVAEQSGKVRIIAPESVCEVLPESLRLDLVPSRSAQS